jgi:hypothetical protein
MGELHAVVPMVPINDAIVGKIDVARRNVDISTRLRDMFQGTVDSQKVMLAKLQRDLAEGEAQVAKMDEAVKRDEHKLSRLEAGEDVPVVKALDYAAVRAICKENGWTRSMFHQAALMAGLDDEGFREYLDELKRIQKDGRGDTRALNRVLRRRRVREGQT